MTSLVIQQDPRQHSVTRKLRQEVRRAIVRQVEQGVSAREARMSSAVPMHRTTVYRLLKRVQCEGTDALTDGRHGHPVKLRGEILAQVCEHCQANPSVSSSAAPVGVNSLIVWFSRSCRAQP